MASELQRQILEDEILRSPNTGLTNFVEELRVRCYMFKLTSIFGTIVMMSPIIFLVHTDLSDPSIMNISFGELFRSKLEILMKIACVTVPLIIFFKLRIVAYERNLNKLRRTLNMQWELMFSYMHRGRLFEVAIELSKNRPKKIQDEILRLLKKLRIEEGLHGVDQQISNQRDELHLC